MFSEKDDRPGAKRCPLIPVVLRNAVFRPLEDKDRHDAEPIVGLKDHLLRNQKLLAIIDKRSWIRDRHAISRVTEVTGRAGAVLKRKHVIPAMPLQALMAQANRVSARGGNDCAGRKCRTILDSAALRGRVI